MFIIIPLGGQGNRFKKENYKKPKALIEIFNKPIIYYLLENLILEDVDFVYIPYNNEYKKYKLEEKLIKDFSNINFKFFCLNNQTRGAAETIKIALENLNLKKDTSVLSIDSDNFYTSNIIKLWDKKNKIFIFKDNLLEANYSYIINKEDKVINIEEKNKISNLACCGVYGFNSAFNLLKYINLIIDKNIKQKEEYYISGVIREMIKDNIEFNYEIVKNKNYFNLGTPNQVNIFKRTLLLDLDGTLVNTDSIYYEIWKKLLKKYEINIDFNFFNNFIRGKSDKDFLKFLIPQIKLEDIKNIALKKDNLFIQELKNKIIIFDDVLEFIEKNKNSKIAIVTSCNKKAVLEIIKSYQLDDYINLIIASEDCNNHKPSSEPYLKAIEYFNSDKDYCYIIEDSLSGFKSALNSGVKNIYLRKTKDIIDYPYKFNNLNEINFSFDKKKDNKLNILKTILQNLMPPIKEIKKDIENLKTGYICDIEKYNIKFYDNKEEEIVLKISNFDNELSKVAKELMLYTTEEYFYQSLSNIINIKVPKFYSLFKTSKRSGILMENLNKYQGKFNFNLNININLLMRIVEDISSLHSKFYYQKSCSLNLMKINEIKYYKKLIVDRYDKFIERNKYFLSDKEVKIFNLMYKNLDKNIKFLSSYPLSLCHGDLKSPNIFYKNNREPYYLDWQYIHLNKGVSDIIFLLVESLDFDEKTTQIVIEYYYKLRKYNNYILYLEEIKSSLSLFPFFVTVWFNTEDNDKLLDKVFPIRFLKNYTKYLNYFFTI